VTIAELEWLPIGRYTVKYLQDKLESRSLHRNVFVTSSIDRERNVTAIDVGDTEVMLCLEGCIPMESIRFSAKVEIAATGSHQQDETIGIEVEKSGRLTYGMTLEEHDDDRPYSVDELSYIIADITQDSSSVMDTIFNSYQKRLLDIVFCGESTQRDKFLLLFARGLDPGIKEPRELYDNPTYRSEIRQVLGEPMLEYYGWLDDNTMIIVGENGAAVIGNEPEKYNDLLRLYGLMGCIINLQDSIFARLTWSWDLLYEQKRIIETESTEKIMDVQNSLCNLSADQGMLSSVPAFMRAAVADVDSKNASHLPGYDAPFFKGMLEMFNLTRERIDEVDLALDTLGREIENIRLLASTLSEKQTFDINRAMNILTVVSVVVLPLTLITGIYGMNFFRHRPEGEYTSYWNMPELYWDYGYLITLGMMGLIALGMLYLFWKRGLLTGTGKSKKP